MEVQRLCDMLDKHLADGNKSYLVGNEYSIADIMCFPWALQVRLGYRQPKELMDLGAREFLSFDQYKHLNAWIDRIKERPAVKRGLRVCNTAGQPKPWLNETPKAKV